VTEAAQRVARAKILVDQGRWKEAEAELGRALAAQGADRSLALYYLAWAQQGQGRYEESIATASRCIAEDPEVSRGYHVRAVALRKKGELAAGEEAARTAVQKDAETTEYRSEWAWNLLVQGRAKEALAICDAGLAKYPEAVNLHRARTEGLILAGHLYTARDSALRALSIEAEDAASITQLGSIAYKQKDLAAAEKHFVDALRIRPGYEHARQLLRRTVRERVWFHRFFSSNPGAGNVRTGAMAVRIFIAACFVAGFGVRAIPGGALALGLLVMLLMMLGGLWLYALVMLTPLYTLALRRKPVARALLTRDELDCSTWTACMIGGGIVAWFLAAFGVWHRGFYALSAILLLLPIPLIRAFEGTSRQKLIARIYTGAMAALGVCGVVAFALDEKDAGILCLIASLVGTIVSVPALKVLGRLF
jgi:tetratricopeptide (TPR) repeat protein